MSETAQVTEYELHPLAGFLDPMVGVEFLRLVESIREHGLREKIVLYEGKILDGRNRYHACRAAEREPAFDEFKGDDPLAYVLDRNVHRRHMTQEQRRRVVAKLLKLHPERSNLQIASLAGVSDKTVASVREELEGRAEIPSAVKRADSLGRQQPTTKKPREWCEDRLDRLAGNGGGKGGGLTLPDYFTAVVNELLDHGPRTLDVLVDVVKKKTYPKPERVKRVFGSYEQLVRDALDQLVDRGFASQYDDQGLPCARWALTLKLKSTLGQPIEIVPAREGKNTPIGFTVWEREERERLNRESEERFARHDREYQEQQREAAERERQERMAAATEPPRRCPECDHIAPTEASLDRHRRKEHKPPDRFPCPYACGEAFTSQVNQTAHVANEHSEETRPSVEQLRDAIYPRLLEAVRDATSLVHRLTADEVPLDDEQREELRNAIGAFNGQMGSYKQALNRLDQLASR